MPTKEELQVALETGKGMFADMSKDEPLFIIRASDIDAVKTVRHYALATKGLTRDSQNQTLITADAMQTWIDKEDRAKERDKDRDERDKA